MISFLKQTKSQLNADYIVTRNGETIFNAFIAFSPFYNSINLFSNGVLCCRFYKHVVLPIKDAHIFQKERIITRYTITTAYNETIGCIEKRKQIGLFKPPFFTITYHGQTYTIYEVGLGKEGMKYPIYFEGKQVALIEKEPIVKDNLDEYKLYYIDKSLEIICVILGLFIDIEHYRNLAHIRESKSSFEYTYTLNRKIKDKYDPNFKNRC